MLGRPNRFVLEVEINGRTEKANLRDSGRLPQLIKPGNRVLLRRKKGGKIPYTVFVIFDNETSVIVNSSLHSPLAEKILIEKGYRILKREVKVENARIDFLVEKEDKRLLEVKGCTLVENGVALFPDSPTKRGLKHLEILEKYRGELLFLVMRSDAVSFSPNFKIHREFAEKLLSSKIRIRTAKLEPKIYEDALEVYFAGYIPMILSL